jgi:chromosome segregation ATPase
METFVTPMTERFAQVTATVESRQAEAAESFRLLSERLEGLQTLVGDMSQKAGEAQTSNREEMAVLQDALVKLNANQHTLAGTINQWRAEARQAADILRSELKQGTEVITADVKSIVPRFATLESEAQKLGGMVEGLSGTVDNMHRVTVERYFRRNRMRYWLFGTDDWVAASWPSQSHRIAEELKAVKAPHRR